VTHLKVTEIHKIHTLCTLLTPAQNSYHFEKLIVSAIPIQYEPMKAMSASCY